MSNNQTAQINDEAASRRVRKHHILVIAIGAVAIVASAGGIALARAGGDDPTSVPASVESAPQLNCVQLAQLGPAGNNLMSDAALAGWRQLWSDAHC